MRLIVFIVFISFLSSFQLEAQRDFANGLQLTGQVQMGLPQNDFEQVFNGYPSGIGAGLTIPVGKTQLLRFGAEYGWNSLGREKTLVELIDEAEDVIAGEMDFSSEIRKYHAIVRLSPFKGGFRPYFEVFMGVTNYRTETELGYETEDGVFISERRPTHNEIVNSYGYGGGFMLGLGRHFFFDAKVQVLRGNEVRLVDNQTLTVDVDGSINYNLEPTPMDMVVPQVGLSIVF